LSFGTSIDAAKMSIETAKDRLSVSLFAPSTWDDRDTIDGLVNDLVLQFGITGWD
jgi:hypothetical protein